MYESDEELPDLIPQKAKCSKAKFKERKDHLPDVEIEEIIVICPENELPNFQDHAFKPKQKQKKKENNPSAVRTLKPAEVLQNFVVKIDRRLLEISEGSEIINHLQSAGMTYEIVDEDPKNSLRFWMSSEKEYMDAGMVVVPLSDFIDLTSSKDCNSSENLLVQECRKWKKQLMTTKLSMIVIGLESHIRETKNAAKKMFKKKVMGCSQQEDKPSSSMIRMAVEESLVACHIEENVNYRMLDSSENFAEFLCQAAKSLSERPMKLAKEFNTFGFYAEGSCNGTVKVDRHGVGLQRLWLQQLRQFTNVGVETAQAIGRVYPSPQSLIQTYAKMNSENAPYLLSEIPVRRGQGPLASTRKIGPELSIKIHHFFSSGDPTLILGQK